MSNGDVSHADDTGGLQNDLAPHKTGNPFAGGLANITVTHTLIIIVGALVLLWLFGGIIFRSVRM